MDYFDRILVCLDLSEADETLITSASLMANQLGASKIYFIHVVDSLELPEEVITKYPDLIAPVDEGVKSMIENNLENYFKKPASCEIEINTIEGNPTQQILKWSKVKEADLILMGKKPTTKGSGVLVEKVIKVCPCSLLLIPSPNEERIEKIMVPIDFSNNSENAMKEALIIAKVAGAKVIAQHCYKVPSGYHSTGKSYREFAEIMKVHAEKDFAKFLKKLGPGFEGIKCMYCLEESHNVGHIIHDVAIVENVDLIIMGSKGRSGLASVLLGSVAIKTAKYDLTIPLLILKDKRENLGFLEALLRL